MMRLEKNRRLPGKTLPAASYQSNLHSVNDIAYTRGCTTRLFYFLKNNEHLLLKISLMFNSIPCVHVTAAAVNVTILSHTTHFLKYTP